MLTVEESVVIDKPRGEVFDFFATPDNIAVSGGAHDIGREAKFAVKVVGVRLEYTDELVEFVENERLKTSSKEGRIPYSITLTFADDGTGTKVSWRQEVESLGGVFKFGDGLVIKMYSKDVRSNLEKAKALLED